MTRESFSRYPGSQAPKPEHTPDEAILFWRRNLEELVVRSLAYEYKLGKREPEHIDGYAEFVHRFGEPADKPYTRSTRKGRAKNKR